MDNKFAPQVDYNRSADEITESIYFTILFGVSSHSKVYPLGLNNSTFRFESHSKNAEEEFPGWQSEWMSVRSKRTVPCLLVDSAVRASPSPVPTLVMFPVYSAVALLKVGLKPSFWVFSPLQMEVFKPFQMEVFKPSEWRCDRD